MERAIEEAVESMIQKRDLMLMEKLRELGPGWGIGFRLKPLEYAATEKHSV